MDIDQIGEDHLFFGEEEDFPDGSILRIVFKNFLTYEKATCSPGPRLNVIIGTNGSGKSTIICGVCLATGGSPKVLGRSERLSDYIKHGREQGFVKLLIRDRAKGNQQFKLILSKPNKAEYFHNDNPITQSELKKIIAAYNIQIDNPCTFLAQDKVKSFSEQNPVELLKNTEKAADPELLRLHEELLLRQKEESNVDAAGADTKKKLTAVQAEVQSLVPRVENFRKKEALRTRIAALRKKKAMMECEEAKDALEVEEKKVGSKKKKAIAAKEELDIVDALLKDSRAKKAAIKEEHNTTATKIRNLNSHLSTLEVEEDYAEVATRAEREFQRTKDRNDKWESNLAKLKADVQSKMDMLEQAKVEVQGYEEAAREYHEKMEELNGEEQVIDSETRKLDDDISQFNGGKNKLREMRSNGLRFENERLRQMDYNCRQSRAGEAWRWYMQHLQQFQMPVYVPLLHMQVQDDQSANVLENLIAVRELSIFIFGCKQDERLLTGAGTWKISSTVVPPNTVNPAMLKVPLPRDLKQMGFVDFVLNLFQAPSPVKYYLIQISRLNMVPIGGARVNDLSDADRSVLNSRGMHLYLSDRSRVQTNVSRYSGQSIVQHQPLRRGTNFFTCHDPSKWAGNTNEIKQLEQFLQKKEAEISTRRSAVETSRGQLDKKKNDAKAAFQNWRFKKESVNTYVTHLKTAERSVRNEEMSRPNMEAAKAARDEAKKVASQNAVKKINDIVSTVERLRTLHLKNVHLDVQEKKVAMKQVTGEDEHTEKMEKWNELKMEVEHAENQLRGIKRALERAMENLQQSTGLLAVRESEMNAAQKKIWQQLKKLFIDENVPETLDELLEVEKEEEARLDLVSVDGDKKDAERLEVLKAEQAALLEKVADQEDAARKRKGKLEETLNKWVEPVKLMIQRISVNYGEYFEKVGCTGEVQLDEPEDKLQIDKYGVSILVRFRASERLRRLDNHVQSGGERSVSTMLYLLALQEECPVPFRCVDEINQGMDPTNERKVFDIMVEKLSGTGNLAKSQYFLLTPKLLRGLKYTESVTVLIVHNGPTLQPLCAEKWDTMRVLKNMQARKAATRAQ